MITNKREQKNKKQIAFFWESFRDNAIPKDASPEQRTTLRETFYAGAWSILSIMVNAADSDMTVESGAELFNSLCHEVSNHYRDKWKSDSN